MQAVSITLAVASLAVFGVAVGPRISFADTKTRISGPHTHENLSVYFIHGTSADGPVPLTLQEALDKGSVRVLETGEVNELKVENVGEEEIFIQSGDIVKGGKQDRVLHLSFVLPPKSGAVPIAAFCVEAGRWAARGGESVAAFSSAAHAMPTRAAKLAMRAPSAVAGLSALGASGSSEATYTRQKKVWDSVAAAQYSLSQNLNASVASETSATSMQLTLENEKLKKARDDYSSVLEGPAGKDADIIGYVIAVNGSVASADVYPSNGLFRKMWPKQLAAGVTEAIGSKGQKEAAAPPSVEAVQTFLTAAEAGKAQKEPVGGLSEQEVRDADKALYVEARRSNGAFIHRSYVAK